MPTSEHSGHDPVVVERLAIGLFRAPTAGGTGDIPSRTGLKAIPHERLELRQVGWQSRNVTGHQAARVDPELIVSPLCWVRRLCHGVLVSLWSDYFLVASIAVCS